MSLQIIVSYQDTSGEAQKIELISVPVNDFLAVTVGERVCHLADVQGRLGLGKPEQRGIIFVSGILIQDTKM